MLLRFDKLEKTKKEPSATAKNMLKYDYMIWAALNPVKQDSVMKHEAGQSTVSTYYVHLMLRKAYCDVIYHNNDKYHHITHP